MQKKTAKIVLGGKILLKRFCIYLLLGIGIVLTIPKSAQAVSSIGSCDFNAAESTEDQPAIGAGYDYKNKVHYCDTGDIMEINTAMSRTWALMDLNGANNDAPANTVSITISADGSLTSTVNGAANIIASDSDEATIVNRGAMTAGTKTINISSGTNATITNSGTITTNSNRNIAIEATGAGLAIINSGDITITGTNAIKALGTSATITNNSGGTIQSAGTTINSTASTFKLTNNSEGEVISTVNNGVVLAGDGAFAVAGLVCPPRALRAAFCSSIGSHPVALRPQK